MPLTEPTRVVLKQPTGASWTISPTNLLPDDADAVAYIAAVEAADTAAGSPGGLEPAVKLAINSFVKGCKADGIWPAIKASCILAGARTLDGALVPLAGTAPTNYNFVAGDYNRKTGLAGDGSTKYLDSNRDNSADPQNSKHLSVFVSALGGASDQYFIAAGEYTGSGNSSIFRASNAFWGRINVASSTAAAAVNSGIQPTPAFVGMGRSASNLQTIKVQGVTVQNTFASVTPLNASVRIFSGPDTQRLYSASRLAFYSIGEALDLALLDARVTALVNALAAAIP